MAVGNGIRNIFPVDTVNADGDTVQIRLLQGDFFSVGVEDETAADNGLFVHKYGKISFSYDFDDPLVVPNEFTLEVLDKDFFYDSFFDAGGGSGPSFYNRILQCDVLINSSVVFRGYAYEDDVTYNFVTKILSCRFASALDRLNKQAMKDPDTGSQLDPLGYSGTWPYRRFDLILDDMFELAEDTLGVPDVIHNWDFGNRIAAPVYSIDLDETYWGTLFWFATANIEVDTLGELLREWAFEFGCYTGIWGLQPFFIQLWVAHSGNSQTLTGIELITKAYKFQKLEYLRYTVDTLPGLKQIKGDPDKSGIKEKTIEKEIEFYFYDLTSSSGTRILTSLYSSPDSRRFVSCGRDPDIDNTWQSHTPLLADAHWKYRGGGGSNSDVLYLRGDIFRYPRVNANPTKHFTFDSRNYFIIRLDIDVEANETIIEASIIP